MMETPRARDEADYRQSSRATEMKGEQLAFGVVTILMRRFQVHACLD